MFFARQMLKYTEIVVINGFGFDLHAGAHHIDLRPATPDDPDWLVALRESELKIISGWLSDYYGAGGALFQPVAAKGSSSS